MRNIRAGSAACMFGNPNMLQCRWFGSPTYLAKRAVTLQNRAGRITQRTSKELISFRAASWGKALCFRLSQSETTHLLPKGRAPDSEQLRRGTNFAACGRQRAEDVTLFRALADVLERPHLQPQRGYRRSAPETNRRALPIVRVRARRLFPSCCVAPGYCLASRRRGQLLLRDY